MDYDVIYIQKYYHVVIAFFLIVLFLLFLSHFKKENKGNYGLDFVILIFSVYTIYYFGSREVRIGVDTIRYQSTFELYKSLSKFVVRKDIFYDYLNYLIGKFTDFQGLLLINATLYVAGSWYGLRKIFRENYILPFLVFLISPYFINNGINVMRSGIATSIFIAGIGAYYSKEKTWKWVGLITTSVLFHFSLFVPLVSFIITRFFKRTKLIFFLWLTSILLAILDVNIMTRLVNVFDLIAARSESYVEVSEEYSSWNNFFIFGFFPVAFGVYNILVLRYKDRFYSWLLNTYMLAHIPYIILISSRFASRLSFLAEFMMPIILMYPLLINPVINIKFYRVKLAVLIFLVFMIKAYKVLIV